MLTKERCDEIIIVCNTGDILWPDSFKLLRQNNYGATPDEAELFAYRLLDAVKRAREKKGRGGGGEESKTAYITPDFGADYGLSWIDEDYDYNNVKRSEENRDE